MSDSSNRRQDGASSDENQSRLVDRFLPGRRSASHESSGGRFSFSGWGFSRRARAESNAESASGDSDDALPARERDAAEEWATSLRRLIALADARASKSASLTPKSELAHIENHVYLRMLYLMSGQQQQAMDAIPGISPAEQEFWQHTLWGIADYFRDETIADKSSRATQTVAQFRTAIQRLRDEADLEVRNLVFCRKITNYGTYETVPKNEFRAGEQVLIYAEIDNFRSDLTEDGRYRTRLKSTLEIYPEGATAGGRPLEQYDFSPTEDVCRRRRRDYFHSYIINLPSHLPLGDYKLKLTVEDELGGKMATDAVRFRVN